MAFPQTLYVRMFECDDDGDSNAFDASTKPEYLDDGEVGVYVLTATKRVKRTVELVD